MCRPWLRCSYLYRRRALAIQLPLLSDLWDLFFFSPSLVDTSQRERIEFGREVLMCDGNRIADCCWAALFWPSPLNDRQYLVSVGFSFLVKSLQMPHVRTQVARLIFFWCLGTVFSSVGPQDPRPAKGRFSKASISAARGTVSSRPRDTKRPGPKLCPSLLGRLNLWFPSLTPQDHGLSIPHWCEWKRLGVHWYWCSSANGPNWPALSVVATPPGLINNMRGSPNH